MDWLQSLLWDPSSVAHIVLLYAFVVAAGVYLGKIKIFGVSLGVTFVFYFSLRIMLLPLTALFRANVCNKLFLSQEKS